MKISAWWLGLAMGIGLVGPAEGQYLAGVATSNYAGTNAIYRHPSAVVDSRYKVYVNLAATDIYLANTYVRWAAPYSLLGLATNTVPNQYRNERGAILWNRDYLRENLNGRDKRLSFGGEVRGPSALITLNDRFSIGLLSRGRYGLSLRKTSEEIAQLIRNGTQIRSLQNTENTNQHAYLNANAYGELGANFGAVLLDDDDQFWTAGVTLKRVVGLFNTHMQVDNGTHQIVRDPNRRGFSALLIQEVNGSLGYTSQEALQSAQLTPGWLLGRSSAGGGWGLDLGLTYEYRPDIRRYTYRDRGQVRRNPTENKYLYRVSVALVDIGGIRYRNPYYVSQYAVNATNKLITNQSYAGVTDLDEANNQTVAVLGIPASARQTRFRSGLPTALNVSVDYKLREKVYVSGLWTQTLRPARSVALLTPSMLAVVPRWETRWAELSLPIALQDNYSMLTVGLAARLGPVFIGSDHLGGLLNIGNPRGANLYAGAAIPLFRRGPQSPTDCPYPQNSRESLWEKLGLKKRRRY